MANRTDTQADTVHGGNPQYLVDRIVRVKIYNDAYWKEFCFALTTETLIDRAIEIDYVGGTYGGRRRPAKFLCLVLKMLQIQPDEDVVMEYIKQPDYKYLRALGILYLRLTSKPMTIYKTLEPFFADYRKLRFRDITGKMSIIHMDELVDWCFREETICDVTLPAIPRREILELSLDLEPYRSVLEDDLDDLEELEQQLAEQMEQEKAVDNADNGDGENEVRAEQEVVGPAQPPPEAAPESSRQDPRQSSSLASEDKKGDDVSSVDKKSKRRARSAEVSRRSRSARRDRDKEERDVWKVEEKERSKEEKRRTKEDKKEKAEVSRRSRSARRDRDKEERDVWKEAEEKERLKEEKRRKKEEKKEKVEKREKEKWRRGNDAKTRKDSEEPPKSKKHAKKDKNGDMSVDEWNEVRKGLGLKPLSK